MPIVCLTGGESWYKVVSQPISIILVIVFFIVYIIACSMGIFIYNDITDERLRFCDQYIESNEISGVNYETAYITCVIAAVVIAVLLGMSLYNYTKSINKTRDIIFPVILAIVLIITIVVGILYFNKDNDNQINTLAKNIEGCDNVTNWCIANKGRFSTHKDVFHFMIALLAAGVGIFVYYITDIITIKCQAYRN